MTENTFSFETSDETGLSRSFLDRGYVVQEVEDKSALEQIRSRIVEAACDHLKCPAPNDEGGFLDEIGTQVAPDTLNALRLSVLEAMKSASWFRPAYFSLARAAISEVVGNELAMQRNVNLSIQLPEDSSSLLPVHADSLNGDSPFESVLWVPLVDCFKTKSMYILPLPQSRHVAAHLEDYASKSSEDLFLSIEPDVEFLDVPFGSYLLFCQNLLHGNRINRESSTRWSMNCRFKSLLSPYDDKRFGEFFLPITTRPATTLGLERWAPERFDD